MNKWLFIGFSILLLALVLWLQTSKPEPQLSSAAPSKTEPSKTPPSDTDTTVNNTWPEAEVIASEPNTAEIPTEIDEEAPITPEMAVQLMRQKIGVPDPRTPQLVEDNKNPRTPPSAAVLNDPEQYAEYQEARQRQVNTGYLPSQQQINHLSAQIKQAKQDGSKTPADIQQAEEALKSLQDLKTRLNNEGITEPNISPE